MVGYHKGYYVTSKFREIPSHKMGEPHWKNGRCQKFIRTNNQGEPEKCGQVLDHSCHRVYDCRGARKDGVFTVCIEEFYSIESRDKHEANVHGSGW